MKTILVALIILICSTVQAKDLNFSWTPNTETIDGYRFYVDAHNVVVDTIPPSESTYSYPEPTDGKCHAFYITAFKGNEESGNSDVASWCPPPPAAVGRFILTITEVTQ